MPLSQPIVCPVLIGRESFTKALAEVRARVSGGAGTVVLISGEAGIGKSRLAAELKAACQNDGWQVFEGNCFEQDQAIPYSAWTDLFRRYFSRDGAGSRRSGPEISRLVPEIGAVRGDDRPSAAADPQEQRQRLSREIGAFFATAAASAPAAVFLEDVHWADEATLDLMVYLAREMAAARLLLVATYRSDEVSEDLGQTLAELDRLSVATELQLDSLDRSEVREMLQAILGPAGAARSGFVDTVHELTEGNPFFIEEVLRSVQLQPAGANAAEVTIPRSVREAVRRRFQGLGEPARRVARYAAVAGRRFDFAVLTEICGASERELLDEVKELVDAQLILEEAADQFAFRHALTREAIYTSLLTRERRQLHQQIAAALEGLNQDQPARVAGDLSYHFFEAEEWQKALDYASLAAVEAGRAYAPRSAIEHYSRAIAAAGHLGRHPGPGLHRGRGLAFEAIGSFDRALADLEAALASARDAEDREAEWQALTDLGMLWAARDYARTGEYYKSASELAQTIGEASTLAHSMNRLGNWHLNVAEPVEALDLHRQALQLFRGVDDKSGIAATLDLLGMTSYLGADLVGGLEYYKQAVAILRELDDRPALASALATMALYGASNYQNQVTPPSGYSADEAMAASNEAFDMARTIGWKAAESYALWNRSVLLGAQGRYSEAIEACAAGLALAQEIEHRQWMSGAEYSLGAIYLDMLDLEAAESHLIAAAELAKASGSQIWTQNAGGALVSALVAKGKLEAASNLLRGLVSVDMPARTVSERQVWAGAADLALALGEPARALGVIERLRSFSADSSAGRTGVRFSLLYGKALRAAGKAVESEAVLNAGVANAALEGSKGMEWRLLLELGGLLQDGGRVAEADSAYAGAARIILEVVPNVPAKERAAFVARAAGHFPTAHAALLRQRPPANDRRGPLSPRERDIAQMVVRGKSNRAIAEELVLSERTVETHVSNILTKLNFSSRAQIAAWVVEQGLSGSPAGL